MKSFRRRVLILATIAVLAMFSPFILVLGSVYYVEARDYMHRIPFDSAKWSNIDLVESDDPIRLRMIDDLMHSRRLDGRSREDVERILGKPPKTDYLNGFDFVYWVGPERGFMNADSEWLVISFDDGGIVREYTLVRD